MKSNRSSFGGASNDRRAPRKGAFSRTTEKEDAEKRELSKGTPETVTGVISVTTRGVGYLPWEASVSLGDIEIPTEALAPALHGDIVEVRRTGVSGGRIRGEVTRVVERAKEEFVGTVADSEHGLIVRPDDNRLYLPFRLEAPAGNTPSVGTKVLVRLSSWRKYGPVGELVEVIGTSGEHRTEMNAIVLEHGFRTEFPPEVLLEAKRIEKEHGATIQAEGNNPDRLDFRGVPTMTIDPVDAKDFDDAISLKDLGDGTYEVGVHIADVTFFVRPGMAIEEEGRRRATSIYLVDATIPMLPHELSGNVCSLRPNEDRLAFAAIFIMKKDGTVLSRRFGRTIIRSDKRFTYEEAQAVLDTGEGPMKEELFVLRDIARGLKKKRVTEGAIEFEQDEVKFILDEQGKPLRVVRKTRIETNMLIEDFMLLANREVAAHVYNLSAKVPERGMVFLYRIHDVPKADRVEELGVYLRAIGYELGKGKKRLSAKDITNLFDEIRGKPEEQLIKTATIRSMAKAIYSTKNIGHFGLSFEHYTHFTSPIRRYPDMLVHRILASHLDGTPLTRSEFGNLEKLCLHSSEQEAKAVDAERDSIRYKQVEYMKERVGQVFQGIVSGVADWGIYVEEKETRADGLVRVRALSGDYFTNDKKQYAMVGKSTGKKYALGDAITVKLLSADLTTRQLEFAVV